MSQDDDDDDAQLKSLRAVWLAMPDEDPPERGLDALMAAARTKAVQMADGSSELPKATSWWERFVAQFRRPPVLALATVVVLVAGAVLFGHRGMKANAPNAASPSNEDVPTERREHESVRQEAPPPPSDDNAAPHQAAPQVPGGFAHEGIVKESVQAPHNGEDALVDQQQLESAVRDEQVAKDRAKQKLLDQAKTAAARGDCANAKVVAKQLEQQDLGYYRSRVAPDPGIAECLVDHKAAGSTIDNATSTGRAATSRPTE